MVGEKEISIFAITCKNSSNNSGISKGFDACMACDTEACHRAEKKHSTHVYRCHAELTEAVTPLYVGDVLVGYLLFGHVFSYPSHEEGWAVIEKRCESYHVNARMLKEDLFTGRMAKLSIMSVTANRA